MERKQAVTATRNEVRLIAEATGVPPAVATITAAPRAEAGIPGSAIGKVRLMAAGMVSPPIVVRVMVLATTPAVDMVASAVASMVIAVTAPASAVVITVIAVIMRALVVVIRVSLARHSQGVDTAEVIAVRPNSIAAADTASALALAVMVALAVVNKVIVGIRPASAVVIADIAGIRPALAVVIGVSLARRSQGVGTAEVIAVMVPAIRDAATVVKHLAVDSAIRDAATRLRGIVAAAVDTVIRATLVAATAIRDSAVAVINTAVGATVPASSAGMHAGISPITIA